MNKTLVDIVERVRNAPTTDFTMNLDGLSDYMKGKSDKLREAFSGRIPAGCSAADIASSVGMDPTLAGRFYKGTREVPTTSVAAICYSIMGKSCHEVYCEEPPKPIQIPKPLETAIAAIQSLETKAQANALYAKSINLFKDKVPQPLLNRTPRDWVGYRLQELSDNYQVSPCALFSSRTITPFPSSYQQFYYTNRVANTKGINGPSLATILYLSILGDITMDYFLALDYTQFCPIADSFGNVYKDRHITNLTSLYLRLLPKDQRELCSYIVRKAMFREVASGK